MRVDQLLDRLDRVEKSGAGWKGLCPAHRDNKPSLSIDCREGRILLKCHAGCQTKDVLNQMGLRFKDLMESEDVSISDRTGAQDRVDDGGSQGRGPSLVYEKFLDSLALSVPHRESLHHRGIPKDDVDGLGYRSLDYLTCQRVANQLYQKFGESLFSVPGFVKEGGKPSTSHSEGMVIPVRGVDREIKALLIRRESKSKYVWMATRENPVCQTYHVPLSSTVKGVKEVRLVEGILKADVVSLLDPRTIRGSVTTVGFSGTDFRAALPFIQEVLGTTGCGMIIRMAFDADWTTNPSVAQTLYQAVKTFHGLGYSVVVESWPLELGKGLDDLLANGNGSRLIETPVSDPDDWWREAQTQVRDDKDDGLDYVKVASAVKIRARDYIWRPWLPSGCLAILEGDPSRGKSTLTCDLVARLTTGRPMPFEEEGREPKRAMILSAEDTLETDIVPRLMEAGANLDNVLFYQGVHDTIGRRPVELPKDWDRLKALIRKHRPGLLVFDPLVSFLGGRVDTHRDQSVRSILTPLSQLAEDFHLTVLALRHLTKSTGGPAMYRGGGSIGFVAASRSTLSVSVDPYDQTLRVLAMVKTNMPNPPSSLWFKVVNSSLGVGRVEWIGPCSRTADDVGTKVGPEMKKAVDWLLSILGEGPEGSAELESMAQKAGVSWKTLNRAKDLGVLAVESYQKGRKHYWRLKGGREVHHASAVQVS